MGEKDQKMTEFYCHSCGRHTSHTSGSSPSPAQPLSGSQGQSQSHSSSGSSSSSRRKRGSELEPQSDIVKRSTEGTGKKYCSARCKSTGRPGVMVALLWSRRLDGLGEDRLGAGTGTGTGTGKKKGKKMGERVLCSEIQGMIWDEHGRIKLTWDDDLDDLIVSDPSQAVSPPPQQQQQRQQPTSPSSSPAPVLDSQALGTLHAHNRELVRRSARLLNQFGFAHFLSPSKSRKLAILPEHEVRAVELLRLEEGREVVAVGWDGKEVGDGTFVKGEWGLRWKHDRE